MIANEIVLFAGWSTNWKLLAAVALGFILLAVANATRPREEKVKLEWAAAVIAVVTYVAAMRCRLSPEAARAYFDKTADELESAETPI